MNQAQARLTAGMQVTPSVRLLRPLGGGGMGAVWLAEHTALSTRVVVKFMVSELDASSGARARFKREAEAASQVKSPHVVQTFDYGLTADGIPFIVMEHLEGRDLSAEIAARGALEPAVVVSIVTQVAKALSKAHAAGVLHRDIKPENIFLCHAEDEDDDLFVKLLDFGIAKNMPAEGEITLDGQTKTGQVVGTPFYMSPEQVTGQKIIDFRADLWALGVVAYEALTGKRPFDGPSFGALAVKIATTDPMRPSEVVPSLPPTVDAWFTRACAREASMRFASARELAEQLRAAFEGVVSLPPRTPSMSDSGPRDPTSGQHARGPHSFRSTPSDGADAAEPTVSAKGSPISVDKDADGRPSFVLASTVGPSDGQIEGAALARSEPGRPAAVLPGIESDGAPARSGASRRAIGLVAAVVSLGLVAAIVVNLVHRGSGAPLEATETEGSGLKATAANPASTTADPSQTSAPQASMMASAAFHESAPPSTTASGAVLAPATPSASAPAGSALPSSSSSPPSSVKDAGARPPAASPKTTAAGSAPRTPPRATASTKPTDPPDTTTPRPNSTGGDILW